jgi:hypothetical protein
MRTHRLRCPLLGIIGSLILGFVLGTTPVWAQTIDSEEEAFLRLINAHRTNNGLAPLTLSPTLSQAAEGHSTWMSNSDCFSHQCPGEADYVQRMWNAGYPQAATGYGENIAAGQTTAPEVFESWKNSNGHNRNMLNSAWRAMGIARVFNGTSRYGWYWTTDFGTLDDTGAPPPADALGILDNPNLPVPVNQNFSYWFRAQGGTAPYVWKASGKLPAGMKLRNCGELKGRARKVGTYLVHIIVKDKQKKTSTKSFTLNVQNRANGTLELTMRPVLPFHETTITIYTLAGNLLQPATHLAPAASTLTPFTQSLANGVYWAIVSTRDSAGQVVRRELKKLIVQR